MKTNESSSTDIIKTIFLIEDDESDTHFFCEAINDIENAMLCDSAINGIQALEKLRNTIELPDLIFSDIQMPQMDGLACLTEIKKDPRLWDIPVVILSSNVAKVDAVREIGACAFIKKPDSIQQLKEQIEKIVHLDYKKDLYAASFTFKNALSI